MSFSTKSLLLLQLFLLLLLLDSAKTPTTPLTTVVQGLDISVPIPPFLTPAELKEEELLGRTSPRDKRKFIDRERGLLYCSNFDGSIENGQILLPASFVQTIFIEINKILSNRRQRFLLIQEEEEHFFCSKYGLVGKLIELLKFLLPDQKITIFFEGPDPSELYRFPTPAFPLEDERRVLSNVGDILFYFVPALKELDEKSLQERNAVVLEALVETMVLNFLLKNDVFEKLQVNSSDSEEYTVFTTLLNATTNFKNHPLEDVLRVELNQTFIPLISKNQKASRSVGSLFYRYAKILAENLKASEEFETHLVKPISTILMQTGVCLNPHYPKVKHQQYMAFTREWRHGGWIQKLTSFLSQGNDEEKLIAILSSQVIDHVYDSLSEAETKKTKLKSTKTPSPKQKKMDL